MKWKFRYNVVGINNTVRTVKGDNIETIESPTRKKAFRAFRKKHGYTVKIYECVAQ